jgi:hypothetical protein
MDFFLRLKHWQVFIFLLVGITCQSFTVEGDILLTLILNIVGLIICFSWHLLAGHALYQHVPEKINLSYNLFVINWVIVVAAFSIIHIVSDGQGMHFTGLAALPIFYIIYAIIHLFAFPAKALRAVELKEEVRVNYYIKYFFLIVFLPVGVWFLQPRLNAIVAAEDAV